MVFSFTKSGNVIAKDSTISGANYIVNQGKSYIGRATVVDGARNNGKPIISWGQHVVLDDGCQLQPAERNGKFYPMLLGHHVYVGKSTVVEAASVGSHVLIGRDCTLGRFSIVKDCSVIADGSVVPPHAVVGPLAHFAPGGRDELPEAAEEAIDFYCEAALQGFSTPWPEF